MERNRLENLEQEVLQYKEQVSSLQDKLDSISKVRNEEPNNRHLTVLSHMSPLCFTHTG